jgi:hypothetical protein
VQVCITIRLVGVGLVISEDREHGTGKDRIASASATHCVVQVCSTAVFVNAD